MYIYERKPDEAFSPIVKEVEQKIKKKNIPKTLMIPFET